MLHFRHYFVHVYRCNLTMCCIMCDAMFTMQNELCACLWMRPISRDRHNTHTLDAYVTLRVCQKNDTWSRCVRHGNMTIGVCIPWKHGIDLQAVDTWLCYTHIGNMVGISVLSFLYQFSSSRFSLSFCMCSMFHFRYLPNISNIIAHSLVR